MLLTLLRPAGGGGADSASVGNPDYNNETWKVDSTSENVSFEVRIIR